MTTRSSRDRNLGGGEVAGIPLIAAPRASYAAAFTRAFEKSRLSPLGAPQTPRCPSSFQARTSAAEGGRLRFGSAAERRRRCRDRDQELKRDPLPCLINSAGSSTYPTRKSVRTTRATAQHSRGNPNSLPGNWVDDIAEGPHGNLWVATSDGLARWNRAKNNFSVYQKDPTDPHSRECAKFCVRGIA